MVRNYLSMPWCQIVSNRGPCSVCMCCVWVDSSLIARLMGPTWGPSGADRTQVGPMLAPWTLKSGLLVLRLWRNINVVRLVSLVALMFCSSTAWNRSNKDSIPRHAAHTRPIHVFAECWTFCSGLNVLKCALWPCLCFQLFIYPRQLLLTNFFGQLFLWIQSCPFYLIKCMYI